MIEKIKEKIIQNKKDKSNYVGYVESFCES